MPFRCKLDLLGPLRWLFPMNHNINLWNRWPILETIRLERVRYSSTHEIQGFFHLTCGLKITEWILHGHVLTQQLLNYYFDNFSTTRQALQTTEWQMNLITWIKIALEYRARWKEWSPHGHQGSLQWESCLRNCVRFQAINLWGFYFLAPPSYYTYP